MERLPRSARAEATTALWVRGVLAAMTVGVVAVLTVAIWIRPYDREGRPLLIGSHRQIGLPPCTFYAWTRLPCPSCGMTTSFAHLVRGDIGNSLRANAVGTLLALGCILFVPWSVASGVRGRLYLVRSVEWTLIRLVVAFLVLLLGRWLIVVALTQFAS